MKTTFMTFILAAVLGGVVYTALVAGKSIEQNPVQAQTTLMADNSVHMVELPQAE